MVHDYWMYRDDPEFVARMLPGVRANLAWFARLQKPGGSLGPCRTGTRWRPRGGRGREWTNRGGRLSTCNC